MDPVLRVDVDQNMDMVGDHFQLQQLGVLFLADLIENLLQSFVGAIIKHGTSVFWIPNHMISASVYNVLIMFVLHRFAIYSTRLYNIHTLARFPPHQ